MNMLDRIRFRSASRAVLAGAALLVVTACAAKQEPQASTRPAPATNVAAAPSTPAPAVTEQAKTCGRSLGIAVRCNMLTDESDFAILRYMALQGLQAQGPAAASSSMVEETFDLSALEMMNAVGACTGGATDMATLERKIQGTISSCTNPRP